MHPSRDENRPVSLGRPPLPPSPSVPTDPGGSRARVEAGTHTRRVPSILHGPQNNNMASGVPLKRVNPSVWPSADRLRTKKIHFPFVHSFSHVPPPPPVSTPPHSFYPRGTRRALARASMAQCASALGRGLSGQVPRTRTRVYILVPVRNRGHTYVRTFVRTYGSKVRDTPVRSLGARRDVAASWTRRAAPDRCFGPDVSFTARG